MHRKNIRNPYRNLKPWNNALGIFIKTHETPFFESI